MSGQPFGGTYAGRRVLVTGDTGFVGSWTVRWLHRLGAEVIGYSRGRSAAPVPPPAAVVHRSGDIQDLDRVRSVLDECTPDLVMHLAGETLVSRGFEAPAATFRSNVLGGIGVLDAALHSRRTSGVLLVGTPASGVAVTGPVGPYAASKQAVEAIAAGYAHPMTQRPARDRELRVVVVRPGVMVGGDWAQGRLVPDVVEAVRADRPVLLRHPHAVRPWQHVLDGISGLLTVGWHVLAGGASRLSYDLGHPDPAGAAPAHRLVAALLGALGVPDWPVECGTDGSPDRLLLGCAAATDELGWLPTWDLAATAAATAQWYRRAWEGPAAAGAITDQQLETFVERARAGRVRWAAGAQPAGCHDG
jgi:CDP-glucose 4,6-dehydratase